MEGRGGEVPFTWSILGFRIHSRIDGSLRKEKGRGLQDLLPCICCCFGSYDDMSMEGCCCCACAWCGCKVQSSATWPALQSRSNRLLL